MTERGAVRILDLGVGKGGNYLRPERRGMTQFVGVDLFERGLKNARTDYRIAVVRASAFKLPFANGSFDQVQMYYPHDSSLGGLSRADSGLWQELGRVLVPSGEVSVVFDVYPSGKRNILVNNRRIEINDPVSKISRAAESSRFSVSVDTVGMNFLFRDIGTTFAMMAANRARENSRYKNYHLQAVKDSQKAA